MCMELRVLSRRQVQIVDGFVFLISGLRVDNVVYGCVVYARRFTYHVTRNCNQPGRFLQTLTLLFYYDSIYHGYIPFPLLQLSISNPFVAMAAGLACQILCNGNSDSETKITKRVDESNQMNKTAPTARDHPEHGLGATQLGGNPLRVPCVDVLTTGESTG